VEPSPRDLLRRADALLRRGHASAALPLYAAAARLLAAEGSTLKAVAVFKQLREIAQKHSPTDDTFDAEARAALPTLYRALGLHADAEAVEREPPVSTRVLH